MDSGFFCKVKADYTCHSSKQKIWTILCSYKTYNKIQYIGVKEIHKCLNLFCPELNTWTSIFTFGRLQTFIVTVFTLLKLKTDSNVFVNASSIGITRNSANIKDSYEQ